MKKIIFVLCIMLFPLQSFAKENFTVLSSENVLKLAGSCSIDVRVMLTAIGDNNASVYSSGAPCREGDFSFSDDLSQWNLADGQYTLWINGEPSTKRVIMKKIVPEAATVTETPTAEVLPKNRFEQAMDTFGKNLDGMSVSLGVIEENLSSSDYAGDTVKHALVSVLRSALDTLSGFFSDFKNEETKTRPIEFEAPVDTVSPVSDEVAVPTPEENTADEALLQEQPIDSNATVVTQEDSLSGEQEISNGTDITNAPDTNTPQ